MKIIYTHFTFNGTKPLGNETDSFFFRKMAKLSVCSAASQFSEVVCYTDDVEGVEALNLPFTNIIFLDYTNMFPNISPNWWNIPKLMVYALQSEPFLHIDFDVYLKQGFADSIKSADIITECLRPFNNNKKLFANAPKWYKKQKIKWVPEYLICSGLLGSSNPSMIFKNLFSYALDCAAKNNYPIFEDLYSVEEFNLCLLAEKHNKTIHALNKELFIHWQGPDKKPRYGAEIEMYYKNSLSHVS